MRKYEDVQKEKILAPLLPTPSGVGCTEEWCDGEMMYVEPALWHPELPQLRRAKCGECGWNGWC
jgi:hypothetical protein